MICHIQFILQPKVVELIATVVTFYLSCSTSGSFVCTVTTFSRLTDPMFSSMNEGRGIKSATGLWTPEI